jgi:type IV pilus assembly protein PilE
MSENFIRVGNGYSLTELIVVLVIIGVLVLLSLPKLLPIVTKTKTTEAKVMLKQVYTLEQSYKFEHDRYSNVLNEIGCEQDKLVSQGSEVRNKVDRGLVEAIGISIEYEAWDISTFL